MRTETRKLTFPAFLLLLLMMPRIGNCQHVEYSDPKQLYRKEANHFGINEIAIRGDAGSKFGQYFKTNLNKGSTIKDYSESLSIYPSNKVGLLQYHIKDDYLKIFLLSSKGLLYGSKLKISENEISDLLVNLLSHMGVRDFRGARPLVSEKLSSEEFSADIRSLTELLFPDRLVSLISNMNHLIILGEDMISQLPFCLLKPFNESKYLIDRLSYTIAASLNDIKKLEKTLNKKDHYINREASLATIIGNPTNEMIGLSPLPGAEMEASLVRENYKGDLFMNHEATVPSFIQSLEDKDLLYLACHGVVNYDDPLDESYLVMSPNNDDNGLLTARDIMNMNLSHIDMAILSACQTGIGKTKKAGFVGVGRSFYAAGVLNTLMEHRR